MIQFNLLPDVKLEYIRAERMKHTVVVVSSIVSISVVTFLVILTLAVVVFQKQHMNALSKDINAKTSELKKIENLDKILTVQNQLNSLPGLHASKPVTSRLFGYVEQITPTNTSISTMNVDYATSTITLKGEASALETVNRFVDTVKFTKYQVASSSEQKQAFNTVVLTNFDRNELSAAYEISFNFDPAIFSVDNDVKLVVPKIITTRSEIDRPGALFQAQTTKTTGQ